MPKILLLDIENSPNLAYVWGKYQQDAIKFEREWYILSYAFKWLNETKVQAKALIDYKKVFKKDSTDDKELLNDLWKLLNEADIVIAHNGDEFDIKKINARLVFNGFPPPAPYKSIDTLKMARRYFNFTSNKLGDLADHLNVGKKLDTGGFELWIKCMSGDEKAWKKMVEYNKQDVVILEKIYYALRPWDTYHPNLGVYLKDRVCSKCGSGKLQSRGVYIAKTLTYNRFQCQDCGSWLRSYNREKSINKPLIAV